MECLNLAGIGLGDDSAHHVIAVPLLLDRGGCFAIVELVRPWNRNCFSAAEFEITVAIMSWVSACVQKMKRNKVT